MLKEIYLRWIGILAVGLIFPFIIKFGEEYWRSAGFSLFYTSLCWNGCVWIHYHFRKKYADYTLTQLRIFYAVLFTLIYFGFINLIIAYLIDTFIFQHNFSFFNYLRITTLAVLLGIGINAMYETAYFWNLLKEKIVETEKLKTENIQSQFEVLKNQVSPHFLFNSLNTLITLIPENPSLAVEFTEKLSSVYRYILQNKDKELVSLATEINFVKSYIFLQKIRFGENLQIHINLDEKYMETSVAPLTLQMLVENAIKHNVVSTEKPLHLEIYVENGKSLLVKNNLQKKKSPEQSTNLGLQNISNRYKYLSDKMVEVIVTASNFIVVLPLIELKDV